MSASPGGSPPATRQKKKPEPLEFHNRGLTMEIAQLFMSMLHAWGLDSDLDKLCLSKLGILKPRSPVSFGLISREGHMSLMLPGWHKGVCSQGIAPAEHGHRQTLIESTKSFQVQEPELFPSRMTGVLQVMDFMYQGPYLQRIFTKS